MIPAVLPLFQNVVPPEPGKEIYWIAGLLAGAIGFLFWQMREADKARHTEKDAIIKRGHDREDRLLEADAARTETMRHLTAQVETAAKLTQTVVEANIVLRQGLEANGTAMAECVHRMDGMTLELRNLANRATVAAKQG